MNPCDLPYGWTELAPVGGCRLLTAHGRRPCNGGATVNVGGIQLCPVHARTLERAVDLQVTRTLRRHLEREDQRRAYAQANRDLRAEELSVVYYVERAGYIKIGRALNLASRLRTLERGGVVTPPGAPTNGPVTLLATAPGGPNAEALAHQRFAADRVAGEWFRRSPRLDAHIAQLTA